MLLRKLLGIKGNAVCAAGVLLLITSAGNAFGDTFTMIWDGAYGAGSATLIATPDGADTWSVTSLTGNQDGLSVTLFTGDYGGNDNLIYQPPAGFLVDRSGLDFTDGINEYNVFSDGASTPVQECSSAVNGPCVGSFANAAPNLTSFSITPGTGSTVPEPTSVGLVGIMVLGAAAIRRKYRVS